MNVLFLGVCPITELLGINNSVWLCSVDTEHFPKWFYQFIFSSVVYDSPFAPHCHNSFQLKKTEAIVMGVDRDSIVI